MLLLSNLWAFRFIFKVFKKWFARIADNCTLCKQFSKVKLIRPDFSFLFCTSSLHDNHLAKYLIIVYSYLNQLVSILQSCPLHLIDFTTRSCEVVEWFVKNCLWSAVMKGSMFMIFGIVTSRSFRNWNVTKTNHSKFRRTFISHA